VRLLFIFFGLVLLGLGVLGIFLPVLPTTPFLLGTTYCFARGSSRFSSWFTNTRIYKKFLHNFITHRSMKRSRKWTLLLSVTVILLISFILTPILWIRILIVIIDIIKYWYFLTRVKSV